MNDASGDFSLYFPTQQDRLTKALEAWMVKTGDPMLDIFRRRADASVREAYMAKVEKEVADRGKRQDRSGKKKKAAAMSRRHAENS